MQLALQELCHMQYVLAPFVGLGAGMSFLVILEVIR